MPEATKICAMCSYDKATSFYISDLDNVCTTCLGNNDPSRSAERNRGDREEPRQRRRKTPEEREARRIANNKVKAERKRLDRATHKRAEYLARDKKRRSDPAYKAKAREYMKEYHRLNHEKYLARQLKYRQKNRDEINARRRNRNKERKVNNAKCAIPAIGSINRQEQQVNS